MSFRCFPAQGSSVEVQCETLELLLQLHRETTRHQASRTSRFHLTMKVARELLVIELLQDEPGVSDAKTGRVGIGRRCTSPPRSKKENWK